MITSGGHSEPIDSLLSAVLLINSCAATVPRGGFLLSCTALEERERPLIGA